MIINTILCKGVSIIESTTPQNVGSLLQLSGFQQDEAFLHYQE